MFEHLRVCSSVCERLRACSSVCERVRAFANVLERLRTCSSVCERVRARQVAFGRAKFFCVRARLGVFCRHFSSFLVISRHFSSQKGFFRVWRATGGCGSGWAGRAAVCSACFPHRGQVVHHVMIFVSNWFATAAGPRLRWFVLRTIVLQNSGVCRYWSSRFAYLLPSIWSRCILRTSPNSTPV